MDFNKIKPFYYAAKAGSFSKTELNLSSSVISRHVADLEKQYEIKLFHRTKSGLILTQKGEAFFKKVEFLLCLVEQSEKEFMHELKKENSDIVNLIIPFHWGTRLLIPYLDQFIKENPGIHLNLSTDISHSKNFEKDLAHVNSSSLTVALLPYLPNDQSLVTKLVSKVELKLYATESYLAKNGTPKSIDDLAKHNLISASQARNSSFADLDWHLKLGQPHGQARKPILRLSDPFYALADGKDFGIASLGDKNILLRQKEVVNVLPEVKGPTINVYYTYSEHLKGMGTIKKVCNFIESALAKEYS